MTKEDEMQHGNKGQSQHGNKDENTIGRLGRQIKSLGSLKFIFTCLKSLSFVMVIRSYFVPGPGPGPMNLKLELYELYV